MTLKGFSLFAACEVYYNGRASSTLQLGNYLIVHKPDSSLSIHGASFSKPLNYQNGSSKVEFITDEVILDDLGTNLFSAVPKFIIRAENKGEVLYVAVHQVHSETQHDGWSDHKIKLTRSERDLVNQIFENLDTYFPDTDVALVELEALTPYGSVDILIVDTAGIRHIVEVKRKIVSVAGCGQLARYANHYTRLGFGVKQYVAAPGISRNAQAYADNNDQTFVLVEFAAPEPKIEAPKKEPKKEKKGRQK